ncbi:MAG: winged helix DNA-binding protein [Actinobacteria bacterium]|nr:winged helix DNA-binding protein [Actinomycetota bacterium]
MSRVTPDYEAARSWHLADSQRAERVTAFEFALMQVNEAYQRWVTQSARLVGHPDISFNEVVVLHVVRMQERAKDAATIAKLINRDDLPNVLYNLRKLVGLGLVKKVKVGSSTLFEVTERGTLESNRYADLRKVLLLDSMEEIVNIDTKLDSLMALMHVMTGLYDSASREVVVIDPKTAFASESPSALQK